MNVNFYSRLAAMFDPVSEIFAIDGSLAQINEQGLVRTNLRPEGSIRTPAIELNLENDSKVPLKPGLEIPFLLRNQVSCIILDQFVQSYFLINVGKSSRPVQKDRRRFDENKITVDRGQIFIGDFVH